MHIFSSLFRPESRCQEGWQPCRSECCLSGHPNCRMPLRCVPRSSDNMAWPVQQCQPTDPVWPSRKGTTVRKASRRLQSQPRRLAWAIYGLTPSKWLRTTSSLNSFCLELTQILISLISWMVPKRLVWTGITSILSTVINYWWDTYVVNLFK